MGRQRIEHHATTTADPATVYALLRDGAGWPAWAPIDSFELERPGEHEPEGVGAIRLLRGGRVVGHDQITELVPDRRFSYDHWSNLPIRDYHADVDLSPAAGGGTENRWVSACIPEQATMMPKACESGSGRIARVVSRALPPSFSAHPADHRPWCVSITPLDRPVVPPV